MRIIVIGAGIMGLSAARALATDGHRITVIDQGPIPNPYAASVDAHRLIRFPYGKEIGYTGMVAEAYGAWDRLWAETGAKCYHPTGTLLIDREGQRWARDSAETLRDLGHPVRRLARGEAARTFPYLTFDEREDVFSLDTGGVLFADRIVARLAEHVSSRGVRLFPHTKAAVIDAEQGRVRTSEGRTMEADVLVVATGAWTRPLTDAFGGRITPSRQVICYLTPPPDTRPAWERAPMILDIDPEAGFYLIPPVGGTLMKVGDHRFSMRGDPDAERTVLPREAEYVRALARRRIKHFERFHLHRAAVCFYAVAPGERFLAERRGRAWFLGGFSGHGFKFGPLLGERLAAVLSGSLAPESFTRWCSGIA